MAGRRFAEFTNEYPWTWRAQDVEDFTPSLRASRAAHSTIRGYHRILALFVGLDRVAASRRKGTSAAFRDATLFKVAYAWGLRRRELVMLDVADLHRNAQAPQFGSCGALHVRYGKASRGSPPKRRTVLSAHDWAVDALRQYVEQVRGEFEPGRHPAFWVTERRGRVSLRHVNARFARCREGAGLPEELDLHCLRDSYVTHLIEAGFPERFATDQVGHAYAATTAIYTGVSDDYQNRVLAAAPMTFPIRVGKTGSPTGSADTLASVPVQN